MSEESRKFPIRTIKTIQGGKDFLKIIRDFILKLSYDPDSYEVEQSDDRVRWLIPLKESDELEIILDKPKSVSDATLYLGSLICVVPLKNLTNTLVTALELADGLVGTKISLVGRHLVISITSPASVITLNDLDYFYQLLITQKAWFTRLLMDELNWDAIPTD